MGHVLSLKKQQLRCSDNSWRAIVVWVCLEAVIRIGIWCGFLWLKKVEEIIAAMFGVIFGFICLEYLVLTTALAAMAEMQEYIDRRLDEKENRKK